MKNARSTSTSAIREIREAREYLSGPAEPFDEDSELIRVAHLLFELVGAAEMAPKDADKRSAQTLLPKLRQRMGKCLKLSAGTQTPIIAAIHAHELGPLEVELLLLITLSGLGAKLFNLSGADIEDLSQIMVTAGHNPLSIARAFQPRGCLPLAGLIRVEEGDPWILSKVSLTHELLDAVCRPEGDLPWDAVTYPEFLERISELSHLMEDVADNDREDLGLVEPPLPARLARLLGQVRATLGQHADWPLSPAASTLNYRELAVLLVLAGKDLGHLPCGNELYQGRGLAAGLGSTRSSMRRTMRMFAESAKLRRLGWIRPLASSGVDGMAQSTEDAIADAAWELTDDARTRFAIPLNRRLESGGLRQPSVRFENLVLHADALDALGLALAQARNPERLFQEWGLGGVLGYGRGTTLLFNGPSGVGKTAAAEALAAELGRPLLEADSARLLNCWVGETEKNLARIFREAAQTGAVLFFDEADAFFYDRSTAQKSWEVSQINILLLELERFEGLCVLATNRRDCFDPAFERRLTLRVEFRAPTAEMARLIWRKLLPAKLPLSPDVDLAVLGSLGLTGGQIKNAVLNAARRALSSGADCVSMATLLQAAAAEAQNHKTVIGFAGGEATRSEAVQPREKAA